MLKLDRQCRLNSLLRRFGVPIREGLESIPGYFRGEALPLSGTLFANRLSENEVILWREEIRLGKFEKILSQGWWKITYYSADDLSAIRTAYEKIGHLDAVPVMKFTSSHCLFQEHRPGKTLWETERRTIGQKRNLIHFIREMNRIGFAHRDLHCKNIILDGDRVSVIDWDFVASNHCPLKQSYDLTATGLPSPHFTGRASIFRSYPRIGIKSVAEYLGITLDDFDEEQP